MLNHNKQKGFTLVEMLVSIAIFALAVVVIMGAIFAIINTNRKAQTLSSVMTNLNFSLESMTRDIKTGSDLHVSTDHKTIDLFDQDGQSVIYSFDNGALYKNGEALTSVKDVIIEKASFSLRNESILDDNAQPLVFILIKGYAKLTENSRSDFSIQSSISQRGLEL